MAATRAATVTLPGDHVVGLDGPRAGLRRVDDGSRGPTFRMYGVYLEDCSGAE